MIDFLGNKKLILASGSPRRQNYFRELGFPFEIRIKEIEELYPNHLQHHEITDFLANLKAKPFANELLENEILVTSDTIVWHNNKALGKPKNYEDAFIMLQSLSNTTHEVITSICIKTKQQIEIFHSVTKVTFNELQDNEIAYYLNEYQPYDKAGAYGIQEWIGLIGIAKIEGSYANVVGLPVDELYKKLKKYV